MKTADEKARELTPLNEIAARKLKELREVDEYKGSNDSKDAITVMKEAMLEYANQQPEVESQTEKILRIAEVARNDPDFERISKEIMEKVESYGIEGPTFSEYLRSIGNPLKSTLTQDKVRDDKTLFQKEYPLTYDILLKEVYKDETLRLDYAGGDICAISKKGVKQFTPKTELDYWVFDCGVIFRCYDMGKTERELEKALNQNK